MSTPKPTVSTQIIPYLFYRDVPAALDWLARAFGFTEEMRHATPGGMHAQMTLDGQRIMMWMRLLMPDGSSIVLDNLPATDTEGYAGLEDGVDYHTWRLLKGVVLSSLLGISSELAANNGTQSNNRIIVGLRDSVNGTANQAGQRIVSKDLAIQPTLTVRPGYPVRVLVNRDIVLRPYASR